MKKLLLALFLISASWQTYAQIAVENLPAGTTPASPDLFICDQSGNTNKCTGSQVAAGMSTILGLGTFATQNAPVGVLQCLHVNAAGAVSGTGADCGSGGGGGTSPGGSNGQIQYNNLGAFGGFTTAGDCVITVPNIVCTKTNGVAFATSATTDTTNASNITSGTLNASRLPTALSASTSINGTSIPSAVTLLYSGGPLGTPSGGLATNLTGSASGLTAGGVFTTNTSTNAAYNLLFGLTSTTVGFDAGQLTYNPSTNVLTAPTFSGALTGNASTASSLTGTPTQCSGGQVPTGILANGNATGCFSTSGSGTVSSGTAGQLAQYASTGTTVTGATIGAGLALNSGTLAATGAINAQTGTTYTLLATDAAKLVTSSNASAVAWSLPAATTTGFGAGWAIDAQNKGAGALTITPTTSTINGSGTLVIAQNLGCSLTSDGTNYQVSACTALGAASITSLASGSQALGTSSIGSGACATTLTVAVTGGTTANTANITFTTDPNTVVGYKASATGGLYVGAFMTSAQLNIEVCNSTSTSITPGAMSVHYAVTNP